MRLQHGIVHVSGGIGSGERSTTCMMARRFSVQPNVALTSAGEVLSDVDMSVTDDRGKLRLYAHTEGSLLYMRSSCGHYQIAVVYRGAMQTVNVSAGTQSVDTAVRLRTEPEPDEWLLYQRGCPHIGARPTAR